MAQRSKRALRPQQLNLLMRVRKGPVFQWQLSHQELISMVSLEKLGRVQRYSDPAPHHEYIYWQEKIKGEAQCSS